MARDLFPDPLISDNQSCSSIMAPWKEAKWDLHSSSSAFCLIKHPTNFN